MMQNATTSKTASIESVMTLLIIHLSSFVIHRSTVIALLTAPERMVSRRVAFVELEKLSLNEHGGQLRHKVVPLRPTLERFAMTSTQVGRVRHRHEVRERLASFDV